MQAVSWPFLVYPHPGQAGSPNATASPTFKDVQIAITFAVCAVRVWGACAGMETTIFARRIASACYTT
jgi:hypothetical protein